MKYQIKDTNSFFIREDRNSSIVLFKEKNDQFILNESGLVMFKLIIENNQLEEVLCKLKEIYGDVDIKMLENDLKDIIKMLEMYGILYAEQEIIQSTDVKGKISAVDENDYGCVEQFIEKNRCSDFFVTGAKGYYSAVNIRAHIINNQEYYYYKINEKGMIEGVVVVIPNVGNGSVVNITTLILSKENNYVERVKIAKELIECTVNSMINPVNKLRISFYANPGEKLPFMDLFENLGFEQEAELKNEFNSKSLYLYSIML